MEFFNKAKAVRLRSYHDKFLIADEDEETVRQSHDGSSKRARWTVEFIPGNSHLIRLKSYCGKYLKASDEPFFMGMAGKKVLQTIPESGQDYSIIWEPRTEGFHVKLRTRCGKFLRANRAAPPWRNSVTHDIPHRSSTQDWVLWKVEMVDILEYGSITNHKSSFCSSFSSDFDVSECSSEIGSPMVKRGTSNQFGSIQENAMEIFQKAKVVRLKSHHDKYLIADGDEETVTQDRNGIIKNAKWTVEIVESTQCVRFKSCYGKYLTASNMPFLLGMTGKKVLQTIPRRLDSSLEWEPIREGVQIKLKTRYGQYLRANAGLPPWRNHITHDIPHRSSTQDWILWDVDLVEIRVQDSPPAMKSVANEAIGFHNDPPRNVANYQGQVVGSSTSESGCPPILLEGPKISKSESNESFVGVQVKNEGRVINYSVANENGEADENNKKSFTFKGSLLNELKQKLEEDTGLNDFIVCSKNPLNGKLYPLRLHLPPNNANMNIVVVPSTGKGPWNIGELNSPSAT